MRLAHPWQLGWCYGRPLVVATQEELVLRFLVLDATFGREVSRSFDRDKADAQRISRKVYDEQRTSWERVRSALALLVRSQL